MSDALDVTVTLDDVFAVVQGKRVPLAPELAGYLALEIAENSDGKGGDVDPKSVYIAEEGTVVLVKPRREVTTGNTDASIRAILTRLLEASGSKTPALASTARRRATGNMRALIEELEAALIPVNRAAGRRALARLAREVKRVTLGVGRNASVPASARGPSASQPGPRGPDPSQRHEDEPPTRRPEPPPHGAGALERAVGAVGLGETPHAPPPQRRPEPPPAFPAREPATAKRAVGEELRKAATPPPAPVAHAHADAQARPPPSMLDKVPSQPAAPAAKASLDVDALLADFEVSHERPDQAVARDLKAMVGLDPTPPPPPQLPPSLGRSTGSLSGNPTSAGYSEPPAKPAGPVDAGVESLLAMSEPLKPLSAPPFRSAPTPPLPAPPAKPETRSGRLSFPGTLPGINDLGSGPLPLAPDAPPTPFPETKPPGPLPLPTPPPRLPVPTPAPRSPVPTPPPRSPPAALPPVQARPNPMRGGALIEATAPPLKKPPSFLLFALAILVILGGAVAVAMVKVPPGFLTGRTAEKIAQEKAENEAAKDKIARDQQAAACRATLEVTDIPPGAELLLRVGQAPVDIDHMPVGARLEFVATAEGFGPKRTVVPAGATWDPGANGKPRFEVAVQLEKATKKDSLWPAGEAGSQVGGQGPPGTVHIVSTPRGAQVWLLAGIGPEARVEQLIACGADADVLIAGPTTLRKQLHVAAADFVLEPSGGGAPTRLAKVSAK